MSQKGLTFGSCILLTGELLKPTTNCIYRPVNNASLDPKPPAVGDLSKSVVEADDVRGSTSDNTVPFPHTASGNNTPSPSPYMSEDLSRSKPTPPSPSFPSGASTTMEVSGLMPGYVLAIHDYERPSQHDGSPSLSFRAGQPIHVLNQDTSGWWYGELDGKRGWFSSNYIKEADEDVMVPLLHSLSLLKDAARAKLISDFQPSTACIESCVRSVLSATDTLNRDWAPSLQQFSMALADERRRILSALASLEAQSKRSSDETIDEDSRETEVEVMLGLAQQVFTLVRRFLAIASQCGIELLVGRDSSSPVVSIRVLQDADNDTNDTTLIQTAPLMAGKTSTKPRLKGRPDTPGGASQGGSTSDLRSQEKLGIEVTPAVPPLPLGRSFNHSTPNQDEPGSLSTSRTSSTYTTSPLWDQY